MQTVVIFRKWRDKSGDVIAFFPEIPSDTASPYNCLSYEHVGQHGGADYRGCINRTRLAKPDEYKELENELTGRGYDLLVVTRETAKHRAAREKEWRKQ